MKDRTRSRGALPWWERLLGEVDRNGFSAHVVDVEQGGVHVRYQRVARLGLPGEDDGGGLPPVRRRPG